jgi:transposase
VPIDRNSLPNDPEILRQMLVDLTQQLDKTQRLLQQLLTARSGSRSEQLSADQLRLFAQQIGVEVDTPAMAASEADSEKNSRDDPPPVCSGDTAGKTRGRRSLPLHLKRERIVHDLPEQDKHCLQCCQGLRHIGEEISERYEYVPAQWLVMEDACQKYACACTIKTATKPAQPIEKSTAGASLLAHVIGERSMNHRFSL